MTDHPRPTVAQLEQLIVDVNRRQALTDAMAIAEHIPPGLASEVVLGRLLERLGLLQLLVRIYVAGWSGEDIGPLLRGVGVDTIDVEQAMLGIGSWTD